jgi:hypothetical protein
VERGEPGDSQLIINEWGGAWVVPGQVRVVWAFPGQSTDESQTCPTSSLPQISPDRQDPKKIFFEFAEELKFYFFRMCFELTRGSRPCLQWEIFSPISFPWGSLGHKVSKLLSSIIKVHGDFIYI